MNQRTCLNCEASLAGRHGTAKFCRKTCGTLYYQRNETRQCSESDCERPLRARGVCAKHYELWRVQTAGKSHHVMHERTCATCGGTWLTPRPDARFCTPKCKGTHLSATNRRHSKLPTDHPVMLLIAQVKAEAATQQRLLREARKASTRKAVLAWRTARECPGCACWFTPLHTPNAICCSRRCARRVGRRRRRASEVNALGSWVWSDFMRVAQKFNYCCAYCGIKPDGQLDPDHVVPLSRGGYDSVTNLLPSCRQCNGDKRNLLLDEWAADRIARGKQPRLTHWADEDKRYWHLTQALLVQAVA